MTTPRIDIPRLMGALREAIAAVPVSACQEHEQAEVRRACQEMSLYLFHLKEMADHLQRLVERSSADR